MHIIKILYHGEQIWKLASMKVKQVQFPESASEKKKTMDFCKLYS